MRQDYVSLKEHVLRDITIKWYLKEFSTCVKTSETEAVVHCDWAENYTLKTSREVQSAYFHDVSISLHTGYCYSSAEDFGFVSLSDSKDHKAEAVHAALRPVFESLAARGITTLWMCSDGPVSQYRNSKNAWLLRKVGEEL